jgi:hypothetical protein
MQISHRDEVQSQVRAVTWLEFAARSCRVRVRIEGRGYLRSMKSRRFLAIHLKAALEKSMEALEACEIFHDDEHPLNILYRWQRFMGRRASTDLETEKGKIGFEIRTQRLALGLTLDDLGRLAGLNAGHLSELERGMSRPRYSTLEKLARALNGVDEARKFGPYLDGVTIPVWLTPPSQTDEKPKIGKGVGKILEDAAS